MARQDESADGNVVGRRGFLKSVGLGGAALALGRDASASGCSRTVRPNFVFILTDDQARHAIGYTTPVVQTPHLDALARDGIIFDNAYVATPICAASRASMLTGLCPQQHESVALDGSGFARNVVRQKRYKTIAHRLTEAGYTTAFCGKSHLGDPKAYGFQLGEEFGDRTDNATFTFASRFLSEHSADAAPFLLWVAPHQPHVPLLPEQEWLDLYKDADLRVAPNFRESPPPGSLYNQGLPGETYYRDSTYTKNYHDLPAGPPRNAETIIDFTRAYYATISRLDSQVGALIEQLKASGHYENTVIIYLSDNGYFLGNHGLGNKITMHEESVGVPLFFHWKGLANAHSRSAQLVTSLDLYPTILELAGLPLPGYLPGVSLASLLKYGTRRAVHPYVASECVGVGGTTGMGHRMVRTRRWKYILTDVDEEALFDELNDPFELENVVGKLENRPELGRMRHRMIEWMLKVGDRRARPPIL